MSAVLSLLVGTLEYSNLIGVIFLSLLFDVYVNQGLSAVFSVDLMKFTLSCYVLRYFADD